MRNNWLLGDKAQIELLRLVLKNKGVGKWFDLPADGIRIRVAELGKWSKDVRFTIEAMRGNEVIATLSDVPAIGPGCDLTVTDLKLMIKGRITNNTDAHT